MTNTMNTDNSQCVFMECDVIIINSNLACMHTLNHCHQGSFMQSMCTHQLIGPTCVIDCICSEPVTNNKYRYYTCISLYKLTLLFSLY